MRSVSAVVQNGFRSGDRRYTDSPIDTYRRRCRLYIYGPIYELGAVVRRPVASGGRVAEHPGAKTLAGGLPKWSECLVTLAGRLPGLSDTPVTLAGRLTGLSKTPVMVAGRLTGLSETPVMVAGGLTESPNTPTMLAGGLPELPSRTSGPPQKPKAVGRTR